MKWQRKTCFYLHFRVQPILSKFCVLPQVAWWGKGHLMRLCGDFCCVAPSFATVSLPFWPLCHLMREVADLRINLYEKDGYFWKKVTQSPIISLKLLYNATQNTHFSQIINQLKSFWNQIVETTMMLITPDFTPSWTNNKMIENENFACFPC